MKTLSENDLKTQKDNLQAKFDEVKQKALLFEEAIKKNQAARAQLLTEMTKLQGAFQAITDLEKMIGVQPEKEKLSTAEEKPKQN